MKLARFTSCGRTGIGVVRDDRVIPLVDLLPDAPVTMKEVLAGGSELRSRIQSALAKGPTGLSPVPCVSRPRSRIPRSTSPSA